MAETIRAALEQLLAVVKPKYTDPDEIVAVTRAIGAARAALAEPVLEDDASLLREALAATAAQRRAEDDARAVLARWGRQPAWSADDVPPGPFSERELREQWNQQADEYNLWDSLDSCEQLAWAQACAIQRDRNAKPTPSAEGEAAELVAWLRGNALTVRKSNGNPANGARQRMNRAGDLLAHSDLLAQRPEPVPVAERLAELRGMFERILCVAPSSGQRPVGNIELADRLVDAVVSWATLPRPAGEVE